MFTEVSAFYEPKICFCTSTDAKPTNVPNGSFCLEMDTGKRFFFDAEAKEWLEAGAS